MDYLQTTGDRLHDLELDRILTRLAALEGRNAPSNGSSTTPVSLPSEPAPVGGVRSITPAGGTPMQDDIVFAVVGPAALTQSAQTLTLTVSVSPATTVTEVGAVGAVGTATGFAREDHAHRGVHKITGSADAVGNLVFAGAGVAQAGNTFTFSGSGGSSVPCNVLVISPGAGAIGWAPPLALTEFNAGILYRAQHDLTNCTQVRLLVFNPNVLSLVSPQIVAQFSVNGGGTWTSLDGASGPSAIYGAGARVSGWVLLTASAQANVLLRIAVSGGDGATSVPFGSLYVQAK
jgi:hypothetical protein